MINKEYLKEHYNNIFTKSKEKINDGGIKDDFLSNVQSDKRMSLDIIIRLPSDISKNIKNCINKLKELELDSMYFYPSTNFHITVFDILKAETDRKIPENINEYINCIKECVKQTKPFEMEFEGITSSDNAVLVKGFYDNELEKLREILRESIVKNNLKLEERYKTISAHITIARIKDKLKNPEKYISFIENEKDTNFGKMKLESMELIFHNWYDTKKQILTQINF